MDASRRPPQQIPGAGQLLSAAHLHHPHQYCRGSFVLNKHGLCCMNSKTINVCMKRTFGLYVAMVLNNVEIWRSWSLWKQLLHFDCDSHQC